MTIEQKRKLREQIDKIVNLRKEQLVLIEKSLIKPIKRQIELAELVKKNKVSIQHYVKDIEIWNAWITEFFETVADLSVLRTAKLNKNKKQKVKTIK